MQRPTKGFVILRIDGMNLLRVYNLSGEYHEFELTFDQCLNVAHDLINLVWSNCKVELNGPPSR